MPDFKCAPEENAGSAINCPEIFAWGFRNPWRWSFDPLGNLWLGDVGGHDWEEVNLIEVGNNYGWRCREGNEQGDLPPAACTETYTDPLIAYPHDPLGNTAVIGGFVYRGSELSELQGRYIYGDLGSGRIWALREDAGVYTDEELWIGPQIMTSFSEGPGNELYFTNLIPGQLVKLVEAGDDDGPVFEIPENLVDTGCVDPLDPTQPSASMIPYDVHAKLWSDNAEKTRAMAIPDGTTIGINGADDFDFPLGTVLYKAFWLNGKIIETRLFMRRPDGDEGAGVWEGFTYEWDADQEEAEMVSGGKQVMIDGQLWTFPSGPQCDECHTFAAGGALGPETAGLNWDIFYAATGNTANQMTTLDAIGMFDRPLGDVDALPTMPDTFDTSADLAERARGYLHANCSQCHRPGTGNPSAMDWRYQTLLENTFACDAVPGQGDLGLGPNARLVKPGDATKSVIIERMSQRGAEQMPPLATSIAHAEGIAVLSAWIDALPGCVQ
jgi:uncharacterized repeat protein (TIGR03806 family)